MRISHCEIYHLVVAIKWKLSIKRSHRLDFTTAEWFCFFHFIFPLATQKDETFIKWRRHFFGRMYKKLLYFYQTLSEQANIRWKDCWLKEYSEIRPVITPGSCPTASKFRRPQKGEKYINFIQIFLIFFKFKN